ncbi:putative C4-dicarboxylate transporter family protein, DctM subunit [alpha proteobacterium BAL199]|nr:putative C4-dicarboxylate transporter family protein, DctM subunit [alpha proteobacterium BAL199]
MIEWLQDWLPLVMAGSLGVLLFTGCPVALVLTFAGLAFAGIGIALDLMSVVELPNITTRMYGSVGESLLYPSVPMLIFMGLMMERSGVARELLVCLQVLLRRVPGSLAIAVALIGVILAPSAGLIGASVATISLIALPTMLERGYGSSFSAGAIAGAGTLGIICPPAIMLFFLADLLGVRMGEMFLAPLVPVAILLALYILYFLARGILTPRVAPDFEAPAMPLGELAVYTIRSLALPVGLIGLVLGSIVAGIATPTQSSAVGAAGSVLLTIANRSISRALLLEVLERTIAVSAMVFFVVIGASVFSYTFRSIDGDGLIVDLLLGTGLGPWPMLSMILAVIFLLGFIIDWIEIALITLPIFYPILDSLDFGDRFASSEEAFTWIAVLIAINLQTSFLTPPFGFALFFLKGSAPPSVTMADIYRGVAPFVLIQISVLALVMLFPELALWLPRLILG